MQILLRTLGSYFHLNHGQHISESLTLASHSVIYSWTELLAIKTYGDDVIE